MTAVLMAAPAIAADYPMTAYRPAYRPVHRPVPVAQVIPLRGIPQAAPVIWVEAPPQYVQHLAPGCSPCSPYAAVGQWRRTPPPLFPWDSIYRDYGY
jgi:hypothetical protein